MDQQQTFNWLVERNQKLLKIERALERSSGLRALLSFEIAREVVGPIVKQERDAENRTRGFHVLCSDPLCDGQDQINREADKEWRDSEAHGRE